MTSSLRVLVLTNLFPHRPGEKQGNFVLDQVRAFARQGADVSVIAARPWSPLPFLTPKNKRKISLTEYAGEAFELANANYFSLPRFALGEKAYGFAERAIGPKIERLGKFDVLHAHGLLMGHVAVKCAKKMNIPSVVTIHGVETDPKLDDTEGKREKIRNVLEGADKVVLVGSPLVSYCKKYSSCENFVVVGNGCTVYLELESSRQIPRRASVRVVAVSNYEESKGFDLLVEALASPGIRDKVEAVLVGDGFGKLQARIKKAGLEGSVHFTGLLSHRDALAEVMAGDVFCLPSWREAYGIMYAEAMALGKFTMGCKGQGPSDFIRHLETGYLMEAGSTSAVVEGLRWTLENRDEAGAIARRGQEYALRTLTWDANAGSMTEIFGEVIAAGRRGSKLRETAVVGNSGKAPA